LSNSRDRQSYCRNMNVRRHRADLRPACAGTIFLRRIRKRRPLVSEFKQSVLLRGVLWQRGLMSACLSAFARYNSTLERRIHVPPSLLAGRQLERELSGRAIQTFLNTRPVAAGAFYAHRRCCGCHIPHPAIPPMLRPRLRGCPGMSPGVAIEPIQPAPLLTPRPVMTSHSDQPKDLIAARPHSPSRKRRTKMGDTMYPHS
jgi:hypothetical protein